MWDGSGVVLVSKRLDEGKFRWPRIEDGVVRLTPGQLTALIEGLDWTRVHARRVRAPQEPSGTCSIFIHVSFCEEAQCASLGACPYGECADSVMIRPAVKRWSWRVSGSGTLHVDTARRSFRAA